jgi:hypothetical protein
VTTLLAMRSSPSRFRGKAKNKISGGTFVPRCSPMASVVRGKRYVVNASVRQLASRLAGDAVIVFRLPVIYTRLFNQFKFKTNGG